MTSEVWTRWAADRLPGRVLHLDSAAAGRPSRSVLEAVAAHARLEAETGAYVAQESAAGMIEGLRHDLAGLLGVRGDDVVFVESGSAARDALLGAWSFGADATVGVVASEWGPNLEAFAARGLEPALLPVDRVGELDLDGLERLLKTKPPSVVHLTPVAAHRDLVQPVAAAAVLCRAHGVPLWVDAAQALGQVDTAVGADAIYATSRKWLGGPRGVGILAVAGDRQAPLRVRSLESDEAHVAGRVGLAVAVREHLALDPGRVAARLAHVGDLSRSVLEGVTGWRILRGADRTAITSLEPTRGQDVVETRSRLLAEHSILTTAVLQWRAPRDLASPCLRISPQVDADERSLERLAAALENLTNG